MRGIMALIGICKRCGTIYNKLNPYRADFCLDCKIARMEESSVKTKEKTKKKRQELRLDKTTTK